MNRKWMALILMGFVGGCAGEVDMPIDSDGDSLLSDIDPAPNNPDADGDGFDDGEEVRSGTSPLDPEEHPYEMGWKMDSCRKSVQPTGNDVGQIAENFTATAQDGSTLNLHDFCNQTVILVSGAFW